MKKALETVHSMFNAGARKSSGTLPELSLLARTSNAAMAVHEQVFGVCMHTHVSSILLVVEIQGADHQPSEMITLPSSRPNRSRGPQVVQPSLVGRL